MDAVPEVMSAVAVYSYTQSVTYVADNILKSLKDIIRLSGLDPGQARWRLGRAAARHQHLDRVGTSRR